jgi:hypothetical protein
MATAPKKPLPTASIAKAMPIIIGVVAVAYAAAAYFLLLMPKIAPLLTGGSLDASQLEGRVGEDQAYLKRLGDATAAYKTMNPDLKQKVAAIVPLDPDIPGLFVQADALAQGRDLVLVSVDAVPDDKSMTPALRKTVRVAINLAGGTYQQFKLFLSDLERSLRIFDVQATVFTSGSNSYGVVFRAYYIDPKTIEQQVQ